MPIYEFRCMECGDVFEKLLMPSDKKVEMACPHCSSRSVERVVSRTSYAMGMGPGGTRPRMTTRQCGADNRCTTLELPGYSK